MYMYMYMYLLKRLLDSIYMYLSKLTDFTNYSTSLCLHPLYTHPHAASEII